MISQAISFKVIIDKGDIKDKLIEAYGIAEEHIWEVPIPTEFVGKMERSGIEDLFTRNDFRQILSVINQPIGEDYNHVSNSFYIRKDKYKRIAAHHFYEHCKKYQKDQFDLETVENFRKALDFCKEDKWFAI